jgi:hypothetical protein
MTHAEESDPLPFSQVHRATKSRTALLAGALGVTTQHALGSMVEWWDLHSDPRVLEEILLANPEDPAVIVTGEDAAATFELASGKRIDPRTLVRLGFLERLDVDRFRVRGMSRYFATVAKRLHLRTLAERGGRASAAARKAASGTAQPTTPDSTGPEAEPEAGPNRGRTVARSGAEPEPEPNPNHEPTKRREERGDIKEDLFGSVGAAPGRKLSKWETIWAEMVELRAQRLAELGQDAEPQVFKPQRLNHLLAGVGASVALKMREDPDWPKGVDDLAAVRALWEIYLRNTFWRLKEPAFPLEGFAAQKTQEALWLRLGAATGGGEDWS